MMIQNIKINKFLFSDKSEIINNHGQNTFKYDIRN